MRPSQHFMPPFGEIQPWPRMRAQGLGCARCPAARRYAPSFGENIPLPTMRSQGLRCARRVQQSMACRHMKKDLWAKNAATRPALRMARPTRQYMQPCGESPTGQGCGHKTWAAQGGFNAALHTATVCHTEKTLRLTRPALACGNWNLRQFGRKHVGC